MSKKNLVLFIAFLFLFALAQKAFSQDVLSTYIKLALDSNVALKQKNFDIQEARIDLERAKTLFYPSVNFSSQYTVANGGRSIDIPVGDLLNPVYGTLNQLTSSTKFPQIQNQSVKFLPNDYNDSKIELTVPIYNANLKYNKELKEGLINNYLEDEVIYKRDLVLNVKQAYYAYLQTAKAVSIYTNALATVNENLRFSEKLVKNNAATKDIFLKAKAQVSNVQSLLAEAKQEQNNAAAYLNFLLNRPLNAIVAEDSLLFQQNEKETSLNVELTVNREEITKLKNTQNVLQTNLQLNNTYKLPQLNAFYNAGFQGYGYKFNSNHFYQLAGLQLTWNIFKGNDNKLKAKQTEIDIEAINSKMTDVENQLKLQVTTIYNSYTAAIETLNNSIDEVASTKEAFRIIDKKFKEGQALQIEWIDARTQMTNAEIEYSLKQLDVLSKNAALERATATYKF